MVASGPGCELRFNRTDDVLEIFEVAIVQAKTAGKFPDSLNRVEFWAVGSQKVQGGRRAARARAGGISPCDSKRCR